MKLLLEIKTKRPHEAIKNQISQALSLLGLSHKLTPVGETTAYVPLITKEVLHVKIPES